VLVGSALAVLDRPGAVVVVERLGVVLAVPRQVDPVVAAVLDVAQHLRQDRAGDVRQLRARLGLERHVERPSRVVERAQLHVEHRELVRPGEARHPSQVAHRVVPRGADVGALVGAVDPHRQEPALALHRHLGVQLGDEPGDGAVGVEGAPLGGALVDRESLLEPLGALGREDEEVVAHAAPLVG
jgi:hypothetical protein